MADVPISYFKAVRSSGKFQPSNPPDLETPPPVINPPGSGGGVNLFKNLGDVTDRSFLGKNGYVPVVTAENLLSLQPLPQVPDNGLISGGIVQWTGTGYVFNVSSCFYRISGEPYSTDPTQKTLSTPDVTNNRIDVFAVDINSLVVVIEGTPSATPVKPQIDPSTQIELTSVIVTASSTEPTLTEEIIYDENIEWTGTSAGTGTVSFNSAVDPFEGTVSIETTDIQNGFIVKLTNSIDVDISTFQTLGFQLNLKASMPSNQNLYGLFINSAGDAVSNKFLLNFDKSLAGSYQFIGIALNTLSFTSNDIRAIYFSFERLAGSPTYSGYYLDVIKLEGGINPPVNVGGIEDVIAGTNITIDKTNPKKPIISSTGGGGISDAPNDGLAYTRKSLGWVQSSPYDLAQVSATDGQTLTWVAANSRYEPVTPSGGSSLWTAGTGFIYRDGPVGIGSTTFTPSAITLYVKNKTTNYTLFLEDSSGTNTLYQRDEGNLSVTGFGNTGGGEATFTVKTTNPLTSSIIFRIRDSSSNNILAFTPAIFDLRSTKALITGIGGTGGASAVLKIVNNNANVSSRIFELYQGLSARLFVLGDRFLWEIPYFSIGNPSSQLSNGFTMKGGVSTATGIFRVDNSSNLSCLEIRGNRQIIMAGVLAQTTDPGVPGALWNNAGVINISP